MKINFDWHNFMSKNNTLRNSQISEGFESYKGQVKRTKTDYKQTIVDISDKVTDDFKYGDHGKIAERLSAAMGGEEYLAVQRDFMTVMSNSMSTSDFQKMQEEGYDISSMEPDQVVTILDKIKTVLAQAGTHIRGYNDNLSVDKITEITGNSGYAETIAKELSYADAPVTEENIKAIDELVDQALTMTEPGEGNIVYMISQKMHPSIANFYKADYSSINVKQPNRMTGYASNAYGKDGVNVEQARKTSISAEDYQKMEQQIKDRIRKDGLEATMDNVERGKWLLERGIPVTGENIELLQDIQEVTFPLNIKQLIKQAALAIGEGKSPYQVNLNRTEDSVYKEAGKIYERYQKLSYQAVDYAVNNQMKCSLKNMELYQPQMGYGLEQIQARKTLEEVRLRMTVEANVKLLQSGYSIETASMEDLIKQLEIATKELNEKIFGQEETNSKATIFAKTNGYLKELPTLPISVIGKIPFMEKATISNVVEEGKNLQKQYEEVRNSYETIMTVPRADMGDSIRKAFRNVDDILKDMDLEVNESNRRAIRIMGYNQITITEDNLEKIKEADKQVRNIIHNLKPSMVLEMIREGNNPLEMSMEEIQNYITEHENEFVNDTQKFSEFLYKLDKKKGISETEREAYIGIYRLIRQIEKSDGAVIGSLINQNADINFSNLLSSVRTRKAKHTDIKIDDTTGTTDRVNRKGSSISEQIERGFAGVQKSLAAESGKTPEDVLKELQTMQQDKSSEKHLQQEQMQEIRDIIETSGKQKEYLEIYHQPVTLDYLQGAMILNEKRGFTFKKAVELEQKLSDQELAATEESILNEAQEFLSSMEQEDVRGESYQKMISHTREILEETLQQQKQMNYIDLKELQSIYKQVSVASSLSKEENYEIPVQLGEEITSINLKIVHGTASKGEVRITMDTKEFGKVDARFVETPDGLEGSVLTNYMDGKEILENHSDRLQQAINDALKETKTELKSLFFGVNEKLDINTLEKGERDTKTNVSLLYKVAKEFIYYVKEV